jgi:hypothetical protein
MMCGDRVLTQPQPRSHRQPQQVDPARRHVLAHLAGPHLEAAPRELLVQLGVDQVDLAQVGLGGVAADPRAVLDGRAGVGVALHAEALDQDDGVLVPLPGPVAPGSICEKPIVLAAGT